MVGKGLSEKVVFEQSSEEGAAVRTTGGEGRPGTAGSPLPIRGPVCCQSELSGEAVICSGRTPCHLQMPTLQFMFASNQVSLFSIYTSRAATDGPPGTCSLPEESVHSATLKLLSIWKRKNKINL